MPDFSFDHAGDTGGLAEDLLSARWAAMHQAADAIARMIGKDMAGVERAMTLYPVGLPEGHLAEIAEATEDLCTMLQQGLFAILRARENGAEAKVAAKALLNRFEMRRHALLARQEDSADLAA